MPTYVYRREDGTTFEIEQRITEDALETCPTTGQPISRVITGGTGLIFKGSGFYLTDYARKSGNEKAAGGKTTDGEATDGKATPDKATPDKPGTDGSTTSKKAKPSTGDA